jgi:hypothetical protein
MVPTTMSERALFRGLFDTLIRAAMVAALVTACYQVFSPFLSLVVWSVILRSTSTHFISCSSARWGERMAALRP